MKQIVFLGTALFMCFAQAACSGTSALGESCEKSGETSKVCDDGAICGQAASSGPLKCIKICNVDSECSAGQSCNGVAGASIKGCRIK